MTGHQRRRYASAVNLANLNLNLLVSLDAVLQQHSVSKAAAQMGLSQPAVSASLAQLRRHFDDELLTRAGNEYRLTPLAVELKEMTRLALSGVERVFAAQADFDPARCRREFRLLVSDYFVAVLGNGVAALLADEAPKARVRFTSHTPPMIEQADRALLSHDLMFIPHGYLNDLPYRDLYRDEWVCVVSSANPVAERGLTVEDLQTMPWVTAYHGQTDSTPAVRQMRMLGIEPHVQVVIESFLNVPALVAGTGRVALLQRRLVDRLPLDSGVRALPCPFEAGSLIEAMWWHPVNDNDTEHGYLRDLVMRVAETAVGRPAPGVSS